MFYTNDIRREGATNMPHIHNEPDQHDITVSAWIIRKDGGEGWRCLVHYHKKMDVLMQVGGHIELNETPWQAVAHELLEESGYELSDLSVLQLTNERIEKTSNVVHPVPFAANTYLVGNEHFHSDFSYGFIAKDVPHVAVQGNESSDLRWLTLAELKEGVASGEVLSDVAPIYEYLLKHVGVLVELPADSFSIRKPQIAGATYKRGLPGEPAKGH